MDSSRTTRRLLLRPHALRAVAEQLGMGLEGKILHWGLTHVIYRLDVT